MVYIYIYIIYIYISIYLYIYEYIYIYTHTHTRYFLKTWTEPGESSWWILQAGATWVASQGQLSGWGVLSTDWKASRTQCACSLIWELAHFDKTSNDEPHGLGYIQKGWIQPKVPKTGMSSVGNCSLMCGCQVLDRMAYQISIFLSFTDSAPTNYVESMLEAGCCRRSGNSMFLALLKEWHASRESRERHGNHELALDERFPILAGIWAS